jgi:hypothetical protein
MTENDFVSLEMKKWPMRHGYAVQFSEDELREVCKKAVELGIPGFSAEISGKGDMLVMAYRSSAPAGRLEALQNYLKRRMGLY